MTEVTRELSFDRFGPENQIPWPGMPILRSRMRLGKVRLLVTALKRGY